MYSWNLTVRDLCATLLSSEDMTPTLQELLASQELHARAQGADNSLGAAFISRLKALFMTITGTYAPETVLGAPSPTLG